MNALPSGDRQQTFINELIEDLAFIRGKLRYPFRRMTLMPLLASGIIVGFFLRFVFVATITKNSNYAMLFVMLLICVPTVVAIKRYIDLIRFFPVDTYTRLHDNIILLQDFLQEKRLVTFRHPAAPEIFMISSKNLSALGDEREVLIFVADENRILINSHFTTSRNRFRLFIAASHQQQIIRELKAWLRAKEQQQTPEGVMRHR